MSLESFIKENVTPGKRITIMGVGSVLRSDDGAGMYLIEKLSELCKSDNVLLVPGSNAPENFTGLIKDFAPDKLFIVDAAHMELPIGEIRVLDTNDIGGMSFSTHMLPLPVMLNYLRLEANCEVICIGIQPENTDIGFDLCEKVKSAVEHLAKLFAEAINS
jgi:hydrogenase 3 maturation protease